METDSITIQNAMSEGDGTVVIPHRNLRTGKNIWIIGTSLLLPSDITVLFEGVHLRQANGAIENIFHNQNAWTEIGNSKDGEQHGIRILGIDNPVLDGGNSNTMCEQMLRDNPGKYPLHASQCSDQLPQ